MTSPTEPPPRFCHRHQSNPAIAAAATESPATTTAAEPDRKRQRGVGDFDQRWRHRLHPSLRKNRLPKRIVEREGIVRGTASIQAPTHFELVSPENGRPINYLYTTSPNLDLRRYKGLHIIVTGEEGLDERWANTPVITIQKIQVVE